MNAAITTHPSDAFHQVDDVAVDTRPPSSDGPHSFASYQVPTLTICMLGVFAATAVIHYATQGGLGQALGLGAFLGVWIGGGFGFLVGGVRWGLDYVEADHHH